MRATASQRVNPSARRRGRERAALSGKRRVGSRLSSGVRTPPRGPRAAPRMSIHRQTPAPPWSGCRALRTVVRNQTGRPNAKGRSAKTGVSRERSPSPGHIPSPKQCRQRSQRRVERRDKGRVGREGQGTSRLEAQRGAARAPHCSKQLNNPQEVHKRIQVFRRGTRVRTRSAVSKTAGPCGLLNPAASRTPRR